MPNRNHSYDPMGARGDGMTDDTAAIQAALEQQAVQNIAGIPPNWPSQAAQQWMASQSTSRWHPAASNLVHIIPLEEIGREKIRQLLMQLPMRVAALISDISLCNEPLRFVIVYQNGHSLEINEVDKFPAAEHVSRILLESS